MKISPFIENLIKCVLGLLLIVLILYFLYRVPCLTNSQFIIIRIALSAAIGLVAALFTGFFNYRIQNKAITGGGFAVAIFFFINDPSKLNKIDKCNEPFNFSIYLKDSIGKSDLPKTGFLTMITNGIPKRASAKEDGRCEFEQIPALYQDSPVVIKLDINGWEFNNAKSEIKIDLIGSSTHLIIQPDNSFCCISGRVRNSTGEGLSGVKMTIMDTSTFSDSTGWFNISISRYKQRDNYRLIATKTGYLTWEEVVYPSIKKDVDLEMKISNVH